MEKKHTLTGQQLENLIWVGSIKVEKDYKDKMCSYCTNEPICCFDETGCDFIIRQIVKELKDLTSDQLMDLVFNNKKYGGKKDGGHKD